MKSFESFPSGAEALKSRITAQRELLVAEGDPRTEKTLGGVKSWLARIAILGGALVAVGCEKSSDHSNHASQTTTQEQVTPQTDNRTDYQKAVDKAPEWVKEELAKSRQESLQAVQEMNMVKEIVQRKGYRLPQNERMEYTKKFGQITEVTINGQIIPISPEDISEYNQTHGIAAEKPSQRKNTGQVLRGTDMEDQQPSNSQTNPDRHKNWENQGNNYGNPKDY